MVPKEFLQQAQKLTTIEVNKFNPPLLNLFEIANKQAQKLAKQLKANQDIVGAGAWLMDAQLPRATAEGKAQEHIAWGLQEAEKLLHEFPEIILETRNNILACIVEHHGAVKFTTVESEICCNADCYKFVSVEGFVTAVRSLRDMPFDSLIRILNDKLEEKWNALSLKICIDELEPQYKLIKQLLGKL